LPIPDLIRELIIAHARLGLYKVYDQFAYTRKNDVRSIYGRRA
jgi:hypothetical protein